jgi:hypothetical protein
MEAPTCMCPMMDMEDPRRAFPSTDKDDDNRPKLLNERELPMCATSMTDIAPRPSEPKTESDAPTRLYVLKDNADPTVAKSITESDAPM